MRERNSTVIWMTDSLRETLAGEKHLYFYPKAYLFAGLTEYGLRKANKRIMDNVKSYFEYYIDKDGRPSFAVDKVDQVPFGIAAINLYKMYGDVKYRQMADYLLQKLIAWSDSGTQLIPYRSPDDPVYYVDTLGMVCPFLVRYSEEFKDARAMALAERQIRHYVEHGIDKESFLPFHGILKMGGIKLGPTNWGRGIGWYLLALAEYRKYGGNQFEVESQGLAKTLARLADNDSTWSQFLGTSKQFDATATTMFMYGINVIFPGSYSREHSIDALGRYIKDGVIKMNSGDNLDINQYSRTFGDSELSQGILLMLIGSAGMNAPSDKRAHDLGFARRR